MAIGKRIEQRLETLRMTRSELMDKVPDLTPQALSNLIRRDSVRSEWDEPIAAALGVSVLWLVYGRDHDGMPPAHRVAEPPADYLPAAIRDIAAAWPHLDDIIREQWHDLAKRALTKAKPKAKRA